MSKPEDIAHVIAFRDKKTLQRQVPFREKARRAAYRAFGIFLMLYLLGMAMAGAYVVVKGFLK